MGFDYETLAALREPQDNWPDEAERMYERVAVVGRGSFGLVWMAQRMTPPVDELDDEFVALKNIKIKDEKGMIFAQREISILSELRHPNVIRLIRAFPVHESATHRTRLVAIKLAQGPDLQALVATRGALGLPLVRLVSRHLIAAVSYLHGRGVLHRDIKPANCIVENTQLSPQDDYAWEEDDDLWSDGESAERNVENKKWNMVLFDFGFARALTKKEIVEPTNHLRNSIVNEPQSIADAAKLVSQMEEENDSEDDKEADGMEEGKGSKDYKEADGTAQENGSKDCKEADGNDHTAGETLRGRATKTETLPEEYVEGEKLITGEQVVASRRRYSGISEAVVPVEAPSAEATMLKSLSGRALQSGGRRGSSARVKMRSMSALGTKAFAAPEIRHDLREKQEEDATKSNEALTSCVADYGMIVDAYSVGWTLRVIITGVPPNATISEYLQQLAMKQDVVETGCCGKRHRGPPKRLVRDATKIPEDAATLIKALTMPKPEERMTIRESQNEPWIRGGPHEEPYVLPEGDYPSKHGDPVVPLDCAEILTTQAGSLSQLIA